MGDTDISRLTERRIFIDSFFYEHFTSTRFWKGF